MSIPELNLEPAVGSEEAGNGPDVFLDGLEPLDLDCCAFTTAH